MHHHRLAVGFNVGGLGVHKGFVWCVRLCEMYILFVIRGCAGGLFLGRFIQCGVCVWECAERTTMREGKCISPGPLMALWSLEGFARTCQPYQATRITCVAGPGILV